VLQNSALKTHNPFITDTRIKLLIMKENGPDRTFAHAAADYSPALQVLEMTPILLAGIADSLFRLYRHNQLHRIGFFLYISRTRLAASCYRTGDLRLVRATSFAGFDANSFAAPNLAARLRAQFDLNTVKLGFRCAESQFDLNTVKLGFRCAESQFDLNTVKFRFHCVKSGIRTYWIGDSFLKLLPIFFP